MSQNSKVTIQNLKSSLKELHWPTSAPNKEVLIERLGWANLPQSFDIFQDLKVNVKSNVFKFSKADSVIKRIPKGSRI